jgi:hypothetical protein
MSILQKSILINFSPLLILLILTIIGVIFGNNKLIAYCGLILTFLCFIFFAFTDKISEWSNKIYQYILAMKGALNDTSLSNAFFNTFRIVGMIPINLAVLARGFFLSLSFWIVDLFISLCEGGLEGFVKTVNQKIVFSFASNAISAIDYVRGNSIEKPGLLSRILSTVGFFLFFKNLMLLAFATISTQALLSIKSLFSSPAWFMDIKHVVNATGIVHGDATLEILAILIFLPIAGIVFSISVISKPKVGVEADARHFGIALLFFCLWLLTLPVYVIYGIITVAMD